jgi:hypothetical protein
MQGDGEKSDRIQIPYGKQGQLLARRAIWQPWSWATLIRSRRQTS